VVQLRAWRGIPADQMAIARFSSLDRRMLELEQVVQLTRLALRNPPAFPASRPRDRLLTAADITVKFSRTRDDRPITINAERTSGHFSVTHNINSNYGLC
jgi:hypothetical protein